MSNSIRLIFAIDDERGLWSPRSSVRVRHSRCIGSNLRPQTQRRLDALNNFVRGLAFIIYNVKSADGAHMESAWAFLMCMTNRFLCYVKHTSLVALLSSALSVLFVFSHNGAQCLTKALRSPRLRFFGTVDCAGIKRELAPHNCRQIK